MNRFKGTKGIWVIKDKPFFDAYSNVWKVAVYSDNLNFCQYIAGKTEEESLANAYLIATAPELLEALIAMINIVDDTVGLTGWHRNGDIAYWDEFGDVDIARDVINKALGQ